MVEMDQRKPKLLKRPIKTKNTRVTPTHDPTSEMHRAIAMGDKDWVKKLLDKGETLCNKGSIGIRRINCFNLAHSVGTWEFVKFLLSVDPAAGVKATNCDGLTLLMLYAKEHKIKELEYVLKRGSYPDDCCVDGSTALMLALSKCYPPTVYEMSQKWDALYIQRRQSYKEKCQYIVDSLIQRGADVDICDINRENALHIAVKNRYTFHLEIVQSLANEGVDHTTENKEHCTVLSYAMETFVELCLQFRKVTLAREVYPTLQFIFDFGSFRVDSFQLRCDVEMHPQTILLKHLNLCQMLTGKKSIFVDLIGSNKNLMNPDLIVLNYVLQNDTIECTKLPFAPLAHYLNYYQYTIDYNFPTQFNSIMENLQYLLSVGFSANVQETISPLTIGLLHRYPHFNYVVFAKCMLNSGVHVEQRLLKYRVLDEFDEELERLSAELCLPDVLRLTLSQRHLHPDVTLELVKMFLPHFAHPGLTLLPFATHDKVGKLFPFLSSCGALQHSALHTTVKENILISDWLSEEHLYVFNQMNSCVPPLQALCRNVVRAHLAPRASQPGNSLPGLIKSVPPLVTVSRKHLLNVASLLE